MLVQPANQSSGSVFLLRLLQPPREERGTSCFVLAVREVAQTDFIQQPLRAQFFGGVHRVQVVAIAIANHIPHRLIAMVVKEFIVNDYFLAL